MTLLYVADGAYIGVRDVAAAASWYNEKLGLEPAKHADAQCVSLVNPKRHAAFVLGPLDPDASKDSAMIYTSDVEKARNLLSGRGVCAGPIEVDSQGTHYFRIQDLDGNGIEITEEP